MRVITNLPLKTFATKHPSAEAPLQEWRKLVETSLYVSFAELKATFGTVDRVGNYYVFDIGGNKYRLIAAIHFNRQMLFVRHVFTHKEYDKWKP